ncbi:ScyD/ScyE family protein [Streptomyces sp. NPDC006879]|uniref:ScyD/ScyE family protein n=1 Tax=Streptomyces sp. NPDC006879 TaxID=3364767 RepID=UPI0036743E4D
MSSIRRSWTRKAARRASCAVLAAGALTATLMPGSALAADGTSTFEVLASALQNPRSITVLPDGAVLVAESGAGLPGCPAGTTCVGRTGGVFKIKGSFKGRVVDGLPSKAQAPTAPYLPVQASGPNQVVPAGRHDYLVVNSNGGTTEDRTALGPDASLLGTLHRARSGRVLGDLTEHETRLNPDAALGRPSDVNSNPYGFVPFRGGHLVTDAAGNTLIRVARGRTHTQFVFPDNVVPGTPGGPHGLSSLSTKDRGALTALVGADALETTARSATEPGTVAVESVPTAIVRGHDAYYIADVGGMRPGAARIWRYVPGHKPTVFVSGLSILTGLAADCRGNLYALTLTGGFTQTGPLPGSIHKINTRTKAVTEIPTAGQLSMPSGIAVDRDGSLLVTNNSVGLDGQLVRIRP